MNYGESGRRNRGLGITNDMLLFAEGQGETEADDICQAIRRTLESLFPKNNQ